MPNIGSRLKPLIKTPTIEVVLQYYLKVVLYNDIYRY